MNLKNQIKKIETIGIYIYLSLYGVVSYLFLADFPLVHSDEPWLGGMANAYLNNKSLFVTESFFDLMPRTVHTIKSLYHIIQIPFITVFGYSITSLRLPSLLAGLLALYVFYILIYKLFKLTYLSLILTVLLSLNLQFIYASHFARQEMLLLMVLLLAYQCYISYPKKHYLPGIIIGIAIALHPNAFIIASMFGLVLLKDTILGKNKFKNLFLYILILLSFVLVHLGFTLMANPDFFSQYFAYGQTLNVDASPLNRLQNFRDFYLKLYYQISGTYYIPPLVTFFKLYIASLVLSILIYLTKFMGKTFYNKEKNRLNLTFADPLLMVLAFNISVFIIGRYNTTSILFLIFPFYLLLGHLLIYFMEIYKQYNSIESKIPFLSIFLSFAFIAGFLSFTSLNHEITKIAGQDYDWYLNQIRASIQEDSVILGNLSSGFAFNNKSFYDIRNLHYLDDLTLDEYIKSRQINTVIYYEEYDYIERNPQWSILYGDSFKPSELKDFLNKKATLTHTFTDMFYGSRIIKYMGDYPWKVYIYTINP